MPITLKQNSIVFDPGNGSKPMAIIEQPYGFSFEFNVTANAVYNSFQGTVAGYTSGGNLSTPSMSNIIDKFPFVTDANATDVGDLTIARMYTSGQSSKISGYNSGGLNSDASPQIRYNVIDKFPFAVNANATDVGDLTESKQSAAGQSSTTDGYSSGGVNPTTWISVIDKFPFATDSNASNIGNLTASRSRSSSHSSTTSGYVAGGQIPSPFYSNIIDKFPFATNANATDVGDLTVAKNDISTGVSSYNSGYVSGGVIITGGAYTNVIEYFNFYTDGNAVASVGTLTSSKSASAGQSSNQHGYNSGGYTPASGYLNVIDKFSFNTYASATDVGDLTANRFAAAGQQV